jgi:ribosomal protein L13E
MSAIPNKRSMLFNTKQNRKKAQAAHSPLKNLKVIYKVNHKKPIRMKIRKGIRITEANAATRRNGTIKRFGMMVKMSQPNPKKKNVNSDALNPVNAIL